MTWLSKPAALNQSAYGPQIIDFGTSIFNDLLAQVTGGYESLEVCDLFSPDRLPGGSFTVRGSKT